MATEAIPVRGKNRCSEHSAFVLGEINHRFFLKLHKYVRVQKTEKNKLHTEPARRCHISATTGRNETAECPSGAEMTPRSAQTNKQTPSSCCLSWGYGHLLFYPFLHVTKCKWLARWRPLRVSVALSVTQVTCRTSLSPAQEAIKQSTNSHTDTSPHDSAVLLRLYWDPSRSNNRNRTGSAFPAVLSGDFYHSEHFTLRYQNTVFPI